MYFHASKEEIEPLPKRAKKKKVTDESYMAYLGEEGIVLESGRFENTTKESWGESKYLGSDSVMERVYIDKEGAHRVDKKDPDINLVDKMQFIVVAANAKNRELREYEALEKHHIRNFFKRLFLKQELKLPETVCTLPASEIEEMLAKAAHEEFALEDFFYQHTEKDGFKENAHFLQLYEQANQNTETKEEQKAENT